MWKVNEMISRRSIPKAVDKVLDEFRTEFRKASGDIPGIICMNKSSITLDELVASRIPLPRRNAVKRSERSNAGIAAQDSRTESVIVFVVHRIHLFTDPSGSRRLIPVQI